MVLADIPGLIEGAAGGAGLGHDFLRHVERTRVLVHVLDAAPPVGDPAEHYRTLRAELAGYSSELAEKREVIVLNKVDLLGDADAVREAVENLRGELRLDADHEVLAISGAAGTGLGELLEQLWRALHPVEQTPQGWREEAS